MQQAAEAARRCSLSLMNFGKCWKSCTTKDSREVRRKGNHMDTILRLEGVTRRFDTFTLQPLNLELPGGVIMA